MYYTDQALPHVHAKYAGKRIIESTRHEKKGNLPLQNDLPTIKAPCAR